MSLSQKHSGKVLVPWFNRKEWYTVWELIYEKNDLKKALDILTVWKLRTPHLSGGVAGTLILLEILTVNTASLSEYEITHIYSTGLIRFLNICAANDDKQGTFYRSAQRNELPSWLVTLRHDIAHGHKIPSRSMLELAVKLCLSWLKKKYWMEQMDCIEDLVIQEPKIGEISGIDNALFQYTSACHNVFCESTHQGEESENTLNTKINSPDDGISTIEEAFQSNCSYMTKKVPTYLIDNFCVLCIKCQEIGGRQMLPFSFFSTWKNLLQIMHNYGALPILVKELFKHMCNESNDAEQREIASLWIFELFQVYTNIRDRHQDVDMPRNKYDDIELQEAAYDIVDLFNEGGNFVKIILQRNPPFTINFLDVVLKYFDASDNFIEDSIRLVSATTKPNESRQRCEQIFTIEDLDLPPIDSKTSKSGWKLIEDTTIFEKCPLGVLPHQLRHENPALIV